MKKLLVIATFCTLSSTGASAQFTTECQRGYFGGVTCQTNADPFYEMNQSNLRRQYQEQLQQHEERLAEQQQLLLLQQQQQHQERLAQQHQQHKERMEQQAHNEWMARAQKNHEENLQFLMRLQAERQIESNNAPEWQLGGLVSREEGKSPDGSSTCNYQTATSRVWVQGKSYGGGFPFLVPRTARCPLKMSISKTTGERK